MLAQYCRTILGQFFLGGLYMNNREEKTFKTFEEQIEGLKRKNLKFKNEGFALNILKRVNYYSFINAYKENFLNLNYEKINS